MNTSPLYEQRLAAPLVKKDFVIGEKLCNYELYITEILNASPWMAKHYVLPFVPPESESNGECDAYAGDYGLDYKLIASKTALQARSILSMQVSKAANGLTFFHAPKRSEGMDITRIAQALRGKTIEELLVAQANTSKKQGIDNDIKQYMETIMVKKNLLLFFPYLFKFDEPRELMDDIETIVASINEDFAVSLDYRAKFYPALDTFFVFIYKAYFALCKWKDDGLSLLDIIHIEKSETFMHLVLDYCDEFSEMYDAFLQELDKRDKER